MSNASKLIEEVPPALPTRNPKPVGQLAGALCISGAAMSLAGSSAPSSGGEHLISHYLDMLHLRDGTEHDLHGCQVGVASVATAGLYERLLSLDPSRIDVAARLEAHTSWAEQAAALRIHFQSLAPAVLPHAEKTYPTREELETRLARMKRDWDSVLHDLRSHLQSAEWIRSRLQQANAPSEFQQIGLDLPQFEAAILHGLHIRPRFSILNLGADLGLLASWTREMLA